jgi:hypothetical protein
MISQVSSVEQSSEITNSKFLKDEDNMLSIACRTHLPEL